MSVVAVVFAIAVDLPREAHSESDGAHGHDHESAER
jgi:hypothetical protein